MLMLGGTLLTALAPFVNIEFLGSSLTFMMVGRGTFHINAVHSQQQAGRCWQAAEPPWRGSVAAATAFGAQQTMGARSGGRAVAAPIGPLNRRLISASPDRPCARRPACAPFQVYVWGRRHQYVNLSFLGIFNFTAPYLPWVLLAFSVMLGSSPKVDLLGMVAGGGGQGGAAACAAA
jgi:hypothetical protein